MKEFLTDSTYHQFYVADRELEQDAPTDWTDDDVSNRHLTAEHISALSPESDIDARIISCGQNDPIPEFPDKPDFEVRTQIEVPSGEVGIYGWPWELEDQYEVSPGTCHILFRGFKIDLKEDEQDYYLVYVSEKQVDWDRTPHR